MCLQHSAQYLEHNRCSQNVKVWTDYTKEYCGLLGVRHFLSGLYTLTHWSLSCHWYCNYSHISDEKIRTLRSHLPKIIQPRGSFSVSELVYLTFQLSWITPSIIGVHHSATDTSKRSPSFLKNNKHSWKRSTLSTHIFVSGEGT